jgi:hypothetical protein
VCRSIKRLRNPGQPPIEAGEIQKAALQFVRKISGFQKPSKLHQEAFDRAVSDIAAVSRRLLESIEERQHPSTAA